MHGSKTVFLPITNPLLATRLQRHLLYKCGRPLELPCSQITQSSSLERQSHPTFPPKHWHVYTGTTNQKDSRNPLPPSPQNVKPVKEQSIYRLRCSISWSDMVTGLQHKTWAFNWAFSSFSPILTTYLLFFLFFKYICMY